MSFWGGTKKTLKGIYRIATDDKVQAILKIVPATAPIGIATERIEDIVERMKGTPDKPPVTLDEKLDHIYVMLAALLKAKMTEQESQK